MVSATSALSAKCMCGADFSRLKWPEFALREGGDEISPRSSGRCRRDGRAARGARAVEERRVHLPLHRQRRQEILRLDDSERLPRPAAGVDEQAGPDGQAHRPRGRREGEDRQGSRGREKREQEAATRRPSAATARCSPPTPARRTSRTRARATCATTTGACRKCRSASTTSRSARRSSEKELDLFKTAGKGEPPARLKEEIPTRRSTSRRRRPCSTRRRRKPPASTRATTKTSGATRKPSAGK